jgi:hypothetical protein
MIHCSILFVKVHFMAFDELKHLKNHAAGLSVSTVVVIALACIVGYENSKKKHRKEKDVYLKKWRSEII